MLSRCQSLSEGLRVSLKTYPTLHASNSGELSSLRSLTRFIYCQDLGLCPPASILSSPGSLFRRAAWLLIPTLLPGPSKVTLIHVLWSALPEPWPPPRTSGARAGPRAPDPACGEGELCQLERQNHRDRHMESQRKHMLLLLISLPKWTFLQSRLGKSWSFNPR